MSKRFTDSEKFSDTWYRKLSLLHKVIWEYLLAECNHAGILENFDLEMMSFKIGAEISLNDLNVFEDRIIFLNDTTIFIPKFLDFQYGILSDACKPHKPVIEKLKKYGLYERVSKGYPKGINTLEEKEKEKDITTTISKQVDTLSNINEQEKNYGEYLNVHLTKKQYGKLLAMCASEKLLNELINSFSIAIEVGKERPYTAELPNAHYERIKSFYNYRKRNPNKFTAENKQDVWDKLAEKYKDLKV